ncbi:endonuclease/exonuclease/phosphatase family protein [Luteolibacter marinus]|uniref:endonuclease/exonuclease/phosphatase family protein n=1 Tax=Luteolibacter marinus TaxID=2776705 RepID=UPI001865E327|nr:endonuclease/exonuclease/phosphatase family protein [Luteolibacter marinus]
MLIALELLASLVVLGTFIPLLRKDTWMVRGWDFPRLQLFVLGLATLAGWVVAGGETRRFGWLVIGLLLASLVALAAWMWRYTPLAPAQVGAATKDSPDLILMVSNVLMSNRESDKLVASVRARMPDIIVALETDQWWTDQLARLSDTHPHAVEIPQDDTYGMVVRSRLPLIDAEVEHIVRDNIPSVHFGILLPGGELLRMHAIHPKPPFPDEDESSTDRDAELLLVAKRVKPDQEPTIVLGDMNDVAWSHTTCLFQSTSGLLDPRIGRGFFSTFHAGHWWMRWPLDHVFVSPHFRLHAIEVLDSVGSDHFPMYVAFTFEPGKQEEQSQPDPDAAERREARQKIAKVS